MKYHISFWKEIPLELSCINSMKCHMKPESVFPVTFSGQKPRGSISFFAVPGVTQYRKELNGALFSL